MPFWKLPSSLLAPWARPCTPAGQHWPQDPQLHRQTHRNPALPTNRPAAVPYPTRLHSQTPRKPTLPFIRPTATSRGTASQLASPAYQCTHSSWPCQTRRMHPAHKEGTPRIYSPGDQRGECCWAPQDISYIGPLLQHWET